MLARSSKLRHPSGVTITTPILVPSFSSKGFSFNEDRTSEITAIIKTASEWLTETALVSAHDCHYKYVPLDFYSAVELCFVDSGGYEKNNDYDLSTVYASGGSDFMWNEDLLINVYDSLPSDSSFVLVSYDLMGQPITKQIESARELLAKYRTNLCTILVKREKPSQRYIDIQSVLRHTNALGDFDIVGLTEKELGKSILDRMYNIARVREELDRDGIKAPIHIFGSLDPVTTILYFLSGAEIFDGLTWLRYSYYDGVATYPHNYGAIKMGIHQQDDTVRAKSFIDNIHYLQDLTFQMRNYLLDSDFSKFKYHSDFFKESYNSLCSKLGGLR
ncbi:hypothetical protein [Pseudanabaena sp. ABRG5-3]|uniref:hypothetical protein n=1 Tax=Pseudanabaena sp. ABRG5-3 TaxID=685565 RepID=UPI000DC7182E|nr:hypothetical protein [Pseudanabaena sp. ABRG5-3]BBC26630.1 hypothetical protein ABRG53_a056 [Pseudanabaena sp. ABRG5-3]